MNIMAVGKNSQPLVWQKYAYGGETATYKAGMIIRQNRKYTVVVNYLCKSFKAKNLKHAKMIIDRQTLVVEKLKRKQERQIKLKLTGKIRLS